MNPVSSHKSNCKGLINIQQAKVPDLHLGYVAPDLVPNLSCLPQTDMDRCGKCGSVGNEAT